MHAVRLTVLIASLSIASLNIANSAVAADEPPTTAQTTTVRLRSLEQCRADLRSAEVLTRIRGVREIARHGAAVSACVEDLIPLLEAPERPLRDGAVLALTEAGETTLLPLQRKLPMLNPIGSTAALRVIGNLSDAASAETAAVVWSLSKSSDEELVRAVGETLLMLGPHCVELAPQLVAVGFEDAQPNLPAAEAARIALRGLRSEFFHVLPLLAERLRRPASGETLLNIEDLLRVIHLESPPEKEQEVVPALVELARNPSRAIQRHAMYRLAALSDRAAAASPSLEKIARDKGSENAVRYDAVRCLAKIVGSKGIGSIAALRDVDSPIVRAAVVISLTELGRTTPAAREALQKLSRDENDKVAALAKQSLASPEARP